MKVESSMIKTISWRRSVLKVVFTNGSEYHYCLVPKDVYNEFLCAESKGRYFNAFVKHQFAYRRAK